MITVVELMTACGALLVELDYPVETQSEADEQATDIAIREVENSKVNQVF